MSRLGGDAIDWTSRQLLMKLSQISHKRLQLILFKGRLSSRCLLQLIDPNHKTVHTISFTWS